MNINIMVVRIVLLSLFFIWTKFIFGQFPEVGFGEVFNASDFDDVQKIQLIKGKKSSIASQKSLKKYCPTVGNQGSFGSCVAYAYAYGGMTILNAIQKNYTDKNCIDKERFSPSFLFNQIRLDSTRCTNSKSREAADFLKEKGICLLQEFNNQANCKRPEDALIQKVNKYTIKDWRILFDGEDKKLIKIRKIKESINAGLPVMATIQVWESFYYLKKGFWELRKDNPLDRYYSKGYHTLVIVGYDNTTFEVMNSWGEKWGDQGFAKIPCEDFAEISLMGVQLMPKDNFGMYISSSAQCRNNSEVLSEYIDNESSLIESNSININSNIEQEPYFYLEGNFQLLKKELKTQTHFEESVTWNVNKRMYEQHISIMNQGTLVQFATKNLPIGKYVYIFSCDPRGKVELHFPRRNGATQEDYYAFSEGETVIIPSENTALQLSHTGDEFFCILYSEEKIDDIEAKLKAFKNYSVHNFWEVMNDTFNDILINPNLVKYQKDRMLAQILSNKSTGTVLPIVLHIETKIP